MDDQVIQLYVFVRKGVFDINPPSPPERGHVNKRLIVDRLTRLIANWQLSLDSCRSCIRLYFMARK